MYSVLCPEKLENKVSCQGNTDRVRNIQYTLQPLRKVWMKVGLEKIENYKGMTVKVLLDSGATGLFMDTKFAKEKEFKLERLKNPPLVRNMDRTINVGGAITYQIKYNIFFKEHVERA